MPFVEVKNLVKRYPGSEFNAVNDIRFDVFEGEAFSLLGPNGAGKTTTLSILNALIGASSGTAQIGGFDVEKDPRAVRRITGVVPQELALYDDLSARNTSAFGAKCRGLRPVR